MQKQFNTHLIDALTLPLDPVRALLFELEQNASDNQLSVHWAARILLKTAVNEIIQTMKIVEEKIGKIEVVQHSNTIRVFDQITDVIFTPVAV